MWESVLARLMASRVSCRDTWDLRPRFSNRRPEVPSTKLSSRLMASTARPLTGIAGPVPLKLEMA